MAGRFSVETIFKGVDRISAPVSRMQARVRRFTRATGRGFRKLGKITRGFFSILKKGAIAGGVALLGMGALFKNIITTGAEYGRAIGAAAAKFPEGIKRGTKEFEALKKIAGEVGETTEFTATMAAKGLNFFAKAGFKAKEAIMALPRVVDFTTAAEIEFAEAADIASDALGAFGLDSADSAKKIAGLQRVMDVMGLAANKTNVSVLELFESVKGGGPVITAAGGSIETFAAITGVLAGNSIKASKAGTATKNIVLALAGIGNNASKVFRRLNIRLADNSGNLRDQVDVLDELRRKLDRFGKKKRLELIESIFGKIPIASATILLGKAGKAVRGFRKDLIAAAGTNKRLATFIRNDVKGSLDSMFSAIEGVKLEIFDMNEGPLKEVIDNFTDWIRANKKLIATKIGKFMTDMLRALPKIASKLGELLGKLRPIKTALGDLFESVDFFKLLENAIKGLTRALEFLNEHRAKIKKFILTVLALYVSFKLLSIILGIVNALFVLNPVVLIIVAIIALIAAVVLLVVWWDELKAKFMDMSVWGKAAIITLFGPLIALAGLIKGVIWLLDKAIENWDKIKGFGGRIGETFAFAGAGDVGGLGSAGQGAGPSSQVVSPQERISRSVTENREVNVTEVVLKTPPAANAKITKGKGKGLILLPTGGF